MIAANFFEPASQPTSVRLPLLVSRVSAGFPSPADGLQDGKLDLNQHLIANKASTFLIRAAGDSMKDAGILDGDLLVVDRSLRPQSGDIVIASVGGEFLVKRIRITVEAVLLEAANERYPALRISDPDGFEVWGVVTSAVHDFRR